MIALLSEVEVAARVEAVAARIAPVIDDETVVVCLLDRRPVVHRRPDPARWPVLGRTTPFDALWPSSYADGRASQGEVVIHAGLQRPLDGRSVLLVDDVFDSGLSLARAVTD